MTPFSPSLLIRFQSEKCSQPAVTLPIFAWLPFDRMMMALYQNSCGIVSLVILEIVLVGVFDSLWLFFSSMKMSGRPLTKPIRSPRRL